MPAALLLACSLVAADSHLEANPVYAQLVRDGLESGGSTVKLPPPALPDGLDAAEQRKVIEQVIGNAYTFERFALKSTVAPHIYRPHDVETAVEKTRVRAIDVYFIAYADFEKLDDQEFLQRILQSDDSESAAVGGKTITAEQLKTRGIELDEDRESYGYGTIDLIKKVRLAVAGHSYFSQTDDSLLAATMADPRFTDDKEFPNRWQSLAPSGETTGEPQPYGGAGVYIKITRLKEPAGALFVEAHVLYAEPYGWFESKNLLGSKLGIAVQDRVRALRKDLLSAGGR